MGLIRGTRCIICRTDPVDITVPGKVWPKRVESQHREAPKMGIGIVMHNPLDRPGPGRELKIEKIDRDGPKTIGHKYK